MTASRYVPPGLRGSTTEAPRASGPMHSAHSALSASSSRGGRWYRAATAPVDPSSSSSSSGSDSGVAYASRSGPSSSLAAASGSAPAAPKAEKTAELQLIISTIHTLITERYGKIPLYGAVFNRDEPLPKLFALCTRRFRVIPYSSPTLRTRYESIDAAKLEELLGLKSAHSQIIQESVIAPWLLDTCRVFENRRATQGDKIQAHRAMGHMVHYLQLLAYYRPSPVLTPELSTTRFQFGAGASGSGTEAAHHALIPQITDDMNPRKLDALLSGFYQDWKRLKKQPEAMGRLLKQNLDFFLLLSSLGLDLTTILENLTLYDNPRDYSRSISMQPEHECCFSIDSRLGILSNMTFIADSKVNLVDDYIEKEMRKICIENVARVASRDHRIDPDEAMLIFMGRFADSCTRIKISCEVILRCHSQLQQLNDEINAIYQAAGPADQTEDKRLQFKSIVEQWLALAEEVEEHLDIQIRRSMKHQPDSIGNIDYPELQRLLNEIRFAKVAASGYRVRSTQAEESEIDRNLADLRLKFGQLRMNPAFPLVQETLDILQSQLDSLGDIQSILDQFKASIEGDLFDQARQIQALFFMAHNIVYS